MWVHIHVFDTWFVLLLSANTSSLPFRLNSEAHMRHMRTFKKKKAMRAEGGFNWWFVSVKSLKKWDMQHKLCMHQWNSIRVSNIRDLMALVVVD